MKRKDLMLAVAAAISLGAFSPAFAGGDKQASAEESMTAPPLSEQSAEAGSSSPTKEMNEQTSEQASTGLDRADQAAGGQGQHGRDNARDKQSLGDSTAGADPEREAALESERRLN
jgi:hypothetical protein